MRQVKIRIFQPIVPEYRCALFNGLGLHYGENIEVWASQGGEQDKSWPLTSIRHDYSHALKRIGPFVWQKCLSLRGLCAGDVIVVCGDVHQLSTLWIAIRARIRRLKVVWWGHHKTATSNEWGVRMRLAIAKRLSDVFLCYTRTGIKYLETHGFTKGRVFATGNTIDQGPIKDAMAACRSLPPPMDKPYLLCVGVLREKIHLDLALRAMTDRRLQGVSLVVIGDGPMKEAWQKTAAELGVDKRVRWLPGTRDQRVMAPWFLGAKAFVYPGSIGLSILHSFSYGLPVITHGNAEHQMPEFEVMEDGKTGMCFKEGDVDNLAEKISEFIRNPSRRQEMSDYCQSVAFGKYSMDQMVLNVCNALTAGAEL